MFLVTVNMEIFAFGPPILQRLILILHFLK